jgi:hypothetical protein
MGQSRGSRQHDGASASLLAFRHKPGRTRKPCHSGGQRPLRPRSAVGRWPVPDRSKDRNSPPDGLEGESCPPGPRRLRSPGGSGRARRRGDSGPRSPEQSVGDCFSCDSGA